MLMWLKVCHVSMVISWMAGSFFLVRALIYHTDALGQSQPQISQLMAESARRVSMIIVWPAIGLSLTTGLGLLWLTGAWRYPWMHVKLVLILGFLGYHVWVESVRRLLINGQVRYPSKLLRLLNEWPFVIMLGILMAVYTQNPAWAGGIAGVGSLGMAWVGIRIQRANRPPSPPQ